MLMIRALDRWLWPYLRSVVWRPARARLRHMVFCLADHFEPFRGGVAAEEARRTVETWTCGYRDAVKGIADADGRPMTHTFFFPAEAYDRSCLDVLSTLQRQGFGEVEVHLHHRNDTADGLADALRAFTGRLSEEHGVLGRDSAGRVRYGFIHGNWALGNSRPDGDWCGVNNELSVLASTGCYADFTFPSAPSPTQPRIVNCFYRARDTGRPRPADRGSVVRAAAGEGSRPDGLMLITGPLALDWRRRKWGLLPRVENSEISEANPATDRRLDLWARQGIHVRGRPDWIFVKTHCHGCASLSLPERGLRDLAVLLKARFDDGVDWRLHWVTAREMYNIARAAEDGASGDPGKFRDYEVMLRRT